MRDNTCFQDWETVVLKKNTPPPINNKNSGNGENKLKNQDSDDIKKPAKITTELKIAIQQARINNKLSQKNLASMMCCQQSLINQYESGKAIPDNLFISKLEKKLRTKLPRIKKQKPI